ncbi:ependymin-like [Leuresthes tenuis]|uniref:ependymin-like n=1 Tax=Leuresthes tenuis TaxID=355514 RepID=UPI003B50330D
MNLISVLLFLSLLMAAVVTQVPKPCVVPPLMTGDFSVMASNGKMSTGTISYDAYGQKLRVRNNGVTGYGTSALDQLMLFNQEVFYEIDWGNLSCKKMPLEAYFFPMQVPSDAILMGQAIMGSSSSWGMGLLVNTWYEALPYNGTYSMVFSDIGCIPLTYSGYSPASGWTTVRLEPGLTELQKYSDLDFRPVKDEPQHLGHCQL